MARGNKQSLSTSARSEFNQGTPSDTTSLRNQYEDFAGKITRDIKSKQKELLDSYQKRVRLAGLNVEEAYKKFEDHSKGLPINNDISEFTKRLIKNGELDLTGSQAYKYFKLDADQKEEFQRLQEEFSQIRGSYLDKYYTDRNGLRFVKEPEFAVDPQTVFYQLTEMTEDFKNLSDSNTFLSGYGFNGVVGRNTLDSITYLSKEMFDYGKKHGETAQKIGDEAVYLKDEIKLDFEVMKGLRKDFQKSVDNNGSRESQTEIWKEYQSTYKNAIENTKKLVDYATENQNLYERLNKYDNTSRGD
jgi:hypothetical protein